MRKQKRVHVAVDGLGAKQGGSATVLLDVVHALLTSHDVEKVTLYSAPGDVRKFDLPDNHKLIDSPQSRHESSAVLRAIWNRSTLAEKAMGDGADIGVSMAATMQPHRRRPYVSFVQQSLPFSAEALAKIPIRQRFRMSVIRELTRRSCRNAARVFVQTPTMRAWVSDRFEIDRSKCDVVFPEPRVLSVPAKTPAVLKTMETEQFGPRLLYVGNNEAYKNVDLVLQSMESLRKYFPGIALYVTWAPDHPICQSGAAISVGYLREGALGKAYALADVLIQPSLVESGPLTMTEAMAVGTPVVVADRPYARDICDDAAVFFNPRDKSHFVEQVVNVLSDKVLRERLIRKGKNLVARRIEQKPYEKMVASIVSVVRSES